MIERQTESLKQEWDTGKRNKFQDTLLRFGWENIKHLKGSELFQLGARRIEVDAWGAWLFEFKIGDNGGNFIRTQGISDDRIDKRQDHDILGFKHARSVKRLDLSTGEWVR